MKKYIENIKTLHRPLFIIFSFLLILFMELCYTKTQLNNYKIKCEQQTKTIEEQKIQIENHKPYRYLKSNINGWCIEEKYQQIMFDLSKRYEVDHLLIMSLCYMEGSRNNPRTLSGDKKDRGLMQINETNTIGLYEITQSTDLELLYDPNINIAMGCYIVKQIFSKKEILEDKPLPNNGRQKGIYWWACVHYNGGMPQVKNIQDGIYTENCSAGKYATRCMQIYEVLYREYNYNMNFENFIPIA